MLRRCCPLLVVLSLVPAILHAAPPNKKEITAVLFTPDGQTLIAASLDGSIRFCDPRDGKERQRFDAHKEGVYGLSLSADGKRLASAGGDHKARLWDLATRKELQTFDGHDREVTAVALSPDGKQLATGSLDATVRLWDAGSGKELHVLKGHDRRVTSVAFAADGKLLASGGIAAAETPNFRGATQADRVLLWDPASGKQVRQLEQRGQVVAFAADGRTLAAAGRYLNFVPINGGFTIDGGTRVALTDPLRNRDRPAIEDHHYGIAFAADGKFLATAWGTRLNEGGIVVSHEEKCKGVHIWELATGKEVLQFSVPKNAATVVAFAPDGSRLALGRTDGTLHTLDLRPDKWDAARAKALTAEEVAQRWNDLGADNAATAYRSLWDMAGAGERSVSLLKEHLKPVVGANEEVKKRIADLDSAKFDVRETARKELARLGALAEPELRLALEEKPSPNLRKLLEGLLEGVQQYPATPEERRLTRALQVLERIGTPEARQVLEKVATGAAGAALTQDAQRSLNRLARRAESQR